jgi:clan AA aspartic protease
MAFPSASVEVFGQRGSVRLDATIDTGFFGELCVPLNVATELGLILIDKVFIGLADGQKQWELLYHADADFLGAKQPVSVFVMDRDDALIGVQLLRDCQMVIDFPTEKVNLFRVERKQGT